jgi:hypothetical protein
MTWTEARRFAPASVHAVSCVVPKNIELLTEAPTSAIVVVVPRRAPGSTTRSGVPAPGNSLRY